MRLDDLFAIVSLALSLLGRGSSGRDSFTARPPLVMLSYLRRILRALNLHKKIEYTARIAPAQLGKAIINRYRRPVATGCDFFSGLNLSADMGRQASGVRSQVSGLRKQLASTEASLYLG